MITIHEQSRLFTLHTRNTTYQMKADDFGVLLHTYYGARIGDADLSRLIRYYDRGFSPNPDEAGDLRSYSLDSLPQEYSGCGTGDFRIHCAEPELPDGSHVLDWRYSGYELREGKYTLPGLPAFHGEGGETLVVYLTDPRANLRAELYYGVFEDYDLITRAVRFVNTGTEPVSLHRAASLCLDLQRADLDFITFDGKHTLERNYNRSALRPGVQSIGSVRGTSSHQHNPFVILCDHDAGETHGICWGAMLLYSGNFEAAVERSQFEDSRLVMGINPYHFCWQLAPGESFTTPEAAMTYSPSGFGLLSNNFHRAIRERLVRDPYAGRRKPVLINSWEACYFDFNEQKLLDIARAAAPLGIELFVLDDGWFGKRDSDLSGLGDWYVNREKLPGGLGALAQKVNELGMQFGLWIEPEMVNEDSDLYRAHPDWVLASPHTTRTRGRSQLVLDFTRDEVREGIYSQLKQVLSGANIQYVKWDMNRSLTEVWSMGLPPARQGEVFHRYVLGVYDMLERMQQDYPQLLIEGCSGGGGRFDAGMLYYTPQIWCSDNTDAVDRLRIQFGTTFAYPVGTIGAHVSASPNEQTMREAPLATRGVVAMSGTFGYELDLARLTEEEKEEISQQVARFKQLWQLIQEGAYYRLTDPFRDKRYTAWQQVSPDKKQALVTFVTGTVHASPAFEVQRLRGLDPHKTYRAHSTDGTAMEAAMTGDWPGDVLMNAGYPVPVLLNDYQSVQLLFEAVE